MTDAAIDLADAAWITHPDWAAPAPPLRAPVLRHVWVLDEEPESARLVVLGLGVWHARINGAPVSDAVLEPGTSEFRIRAAAMVQDLAGLVRPGRNELLIELGEGAAHVRELPDRYTKFEGLRVAPRARVAIVMRQSDGRGGSIVSGPGWDAALGATTTNHWYGGEDYDARLEPSLADGAGGDPGWVAAAVVGSGEDGPAPWSRSAPPMRVVERIDAVKVQRTPSGAVYDFGRNLAGRQSLRLGAGIAAGTVVEMRPSEYLNESGRVDQGTTGEPVYDRVTSAGAGEHWYPRFGYHGFRYLEVDVRDPRGGALPGAVDDLEVVAERIMTDDTPVGSFSTSDPVLSGVYDLVTRAVESNLVSVPTDCPHREKLGWLEQLHLAFDPLAFRFDVRAHLTDMVVHMTDAQTHDGLIPDIAPELVEFDIPGQPGFRDDVNWGSAIWQVPERILRTYGDLEPARAAWLPGLRYLDYIERQSAGGLLDQGLGDWITLDESTPRRMVASYGYARMLDSAGTIAVALRHSADAERFRRRAASIRSGLHDRFVSRHDDGALLLGSGSQASHALLMDLGVLTDDEYAEAAEGLVSAILRDDAQITVGEIALPALVRTLTALGRHELLRRMVTRADGPGYGRMLADGETALTEHWTGRSTNGSGNHFMLGYISQWLTGSVAGLAQHPDSTAWSRARIAPVPLVGVDAASARHRSPAGEYAIAWERDEEGVRLTATVPEGGGAEVVAPAGHLVEGARLVELSGGEHVLVLRPAPDAAEHA